MVVLCVYNFVVIIVSVKLDKPVVGGLRIS